MDYHFKDYYKKFGANIAYYRRLNNLSQEKLAEKVGIQRAHISQIEIGVSSASMDLCFRLCQAFNITPKQLFDFRED